MTWRIEHLPGAGADRIQAHWNDNSYAYDAGLRSGPGVTRTSFGGSSRAQINAWSKPLEGIYRWDDEVSEPTVTLAWRTEPGGPVQTLVIALHR